MKIRKNRLIVFFLMLMSINWEILDFEGGATIQIIENTLRVVAATCSAFLYFKRKRGRISYVFFLLILMNIWLLAATIVNRGSVRNWLFGYICPLIATGLLFESMSEYLDDLIVGCMSLAEVLCYTNFVSIILFPDGMYSTYRTEGVWWSSQNWLLGNKNDFIPYFLFFLLIAYLYQTRGGKLWRVVGLCSVCLLSVFMVNSSTSIVGLVILLMFFLLIKINKIRFDAYFLAAVNVILFFAIVVFRLQDEFAFLIEDLLGKNLTFTGRTELWDMVFLLLPKNLMWGFGVTEAGYLQQVTGIVYAGQAHNLILNCLYRGGIMYFMLYLALMVYLYRQLHRTQSRQEVQGAIATIFVFQVIALMESYEKTFFVNLLYFLVYFSTLLGQIPAVRQRWTLHIIPSHTKGSK